MIHGISSEDMLENGSLSAARRHFAGCYHMHWHEFYEIEYIIEGQGTYELDGKAFPIEQGMVFFMTPVDFHSVNTPGTELINIMFSGDLADPSLLSAFTSHTAPKVLHLTGEQQILFSSLLKEIVSHRQDTAYASALLSCVLMKLKQSLSFPENQFSSISGKMWFYMINHFRSRMTLQDVAAFVGLTPAYLSAVFKKERNQNFKSALNELRLAFARQLLVHTGLTVTEICAESGFDDYPNFIRQFRAHFGVTPVQLRKAEKEERAQKAYVCPFAP